MSSGGYKSFFNDDCARSSFIRFGVAALRACLSKIAALSYIDDLRRFESSSRSSASKSSFTAPYYFRLSWLYGSFDCAPLFISGLEDLTFYSS